MNNDMRLIYYSYFRRYKDPVVQALSNLVVKTSAKLLGCKITEPEKEDNTW